MTTTFVPSEEQAAIFEAVLRTNDNVAIRALAGTGKTTTLVELAKKLPTQGSKLFCAFNKDIVSELEKRLMGTGMRAKTFHSLGLAALKDRLGITAISPDGKKYREIADEWAKDNIRLAEIIATAVSDIEEEKKRADLAKDYHKETVRMMTEMLNYLRLSLIRWEDKSCLYDMVVKYRLDDDINNNEEIINFCIDAIPALMNTAEQQVVKELKIDFTDMIYWVVRWDAKIYQYNWVFVDECQDLSPMQRALVKKVIWPRGGRIVLVGDPHQAIYAFAGADSDSFDLSVDMFQATVMPLTVTRRCFSIITHHAREIVPAFKCPPDKARGKVVWIDEDRLKGAAQEGDMILCRLKGPLVAACLDLITAGKPATILGADIGRGLISLLEKLQKRDGYRFEAILDVLDKYEAEQIEKYAAKEDNAMIEHTKDQCSAIRIVVERAKAPSFEALVMEINALFSDRENGIVLSTIHKSKGMERDRIFILTPEKLPLNYPGMSREQAQQEDNLDYVARTRAKHTLVYLTNQKFLRDNIRPKYAQVTFDDLNWDEPVVSDELDDDDDDLDKLPGVFGAWEPEDFDEEDWDDEDEDFDFEPTPLSAVPPSDDIGLLTEEQLERVNSLNKGLTPEELRTIALEIIVEEVANKREFSYLTIMEKIREMRPTAFLIKYGDETYPGIHDLIQQHMTTNNPEGYRNRFDSEAGGRGATIYFWVQPKSLTELKYLIESYEPDYRDIEIWAAAAAYLDIQRHEPIDYPYTIEAQYGVSIGDEYVVAPSVTAVTIPELPPFRASGNLFADMKQMSLIQTRERMMLMIRDLPDADVDRVAKLLEKELKSKEQSPATSQPSLL